MQVVQQYPDGIFNWVDLATNDLEGAKAFYGDLFGWEAEEIPAEASGSDVYVMFHKGGYNVAGAGSLDPDVQAQGVRPHWNSYIKHDNVDAIAEKATAAGGQVLFPPMDIMDAGRMAMIQDPVGTVFGVWQPRNHIGADLVNRPGALVWNELQTGGDLETARAFYREVFGWGQQVDPNGYVICTQGERVHAGMMAIDDTMDERIPSNWAVYFMVENVGVTAARVEELGGAVVVPPTPAGEMGRFAVVQDPQGGVFTVMQFAGPTDPPPGYEETDA